MVDAEELDLLFARMPRRARAHRARMDHPEIGQLRVVDVSRRLVFAGRHFAREQHLEVLRPAVGDHHVPHFQVGVHAARDAAEHDVAHLEPVQHQLRVHRGVHHADAREEQHHGLALQRAGGELHAVDRLRARIDHLGREQGELRLERRHHRDAGRVGGNGGAAGEQGGEEGDEESAHDQKGPWKSKARCTNQ